MCKVGRLIALGECSDVQQQQELCSTEVGQGVIFISANESIQSRDLHVLSGRYSGVNFDKEGHSWILLDLTSVQSRYIALVMAPDPGFLYKISRKP